MKTYEEKIEAIRGIIEDMDTSDAVALHNEYCYKTNNYDDEIFEIDRFSEICESMGPLDIAMKIFYGDFNPNHNYFRYDGYANFESTDFPTDWIYPDDIARYVVDRDESFGNYDIQEEIDSWDENEDNNDGD